MFSHVMAVQDVVEVRQVRVVPVVQEDGTGGLRLFERIVVQVVVVVFRTVKDGVVDVRAVDCDPALDVRVLLLEILKRLNVFGEVRFVLDPPFWVCTLVHAV